MINCRAEFEADRDARMRIPGINELDLAKRYAFFQRWRLSPEQAASASVQYERALKGFGPTGVSKAEREAHRAGMRHRLGLHAKQKPNKSRDWTPSR